MGMPFVTGTEVLIIRESSGSPITLMDVDRSDYLHFGDGASSMGGNERTTYGFVLGQRGQANIALNVRAGDDYQPQEGWQVFLYELTATQQICVFCGTIDKWQTSWWGTAGDRLVSLSCVSFEQAFGVLRVPGRWYQNQTAGYIFNDLMSIAAGWPGTIGTISAGANVASFLIENEPNLASIFDKLATLSNYIWYVDPTTIEINFTTPGTIAAPFTLEQIDPLWEALDIIADRHDFRNRQYVSVDYSMFAESTNFFVGDNTSTTFSLRNPAHTVNSAFITRNTPNSATGSLGSQPNPGDTVSIGYSSSGSIYNWAPNSPYAVGYIIIDPDDHIQKVVTIGGISPSGSSFGQSGKVEPIWNDAGSTTPDNGIVWQDEGPLSGASGVAETYTFVTIIDNTQFGEVLIGAHAAETLQNLVNAINADTATRGISYSLPTWESSLCNAGVPSGSSFIISNKQPGRAYIAALTSVGPAFAWSASLTSGGITTFNTLTLNVEVAAPGTRSALSLSYQPGSVVVDLPSPLNTGTYLQVNYYRLDGNLIGVENTPLVEQRAEIEGGTGKYQALVADSTAVTLQQALADAQAALAAFETVPSTLEFITLTPGLQVGMSLDVGFTFPDGPDIRLG